MKWPLIIAFSFFAPTRLIASVLEPGDLLVGGRPSYQFEGGNAYLDHFAANGTGEAHIAILRGGHPSDIVQIGTHTIIADGQQLTDIGADGTISTIGYIRTYTESLAADRDGFLYVGDLLGSGVTKLSLSDGSRTRFTLPMAFPLDPMVLALDLATDQCTLFYSSGGAVIQRYDLCVRRPLANFGNVESAVRSIRVLPDGYALVGSEGMITRFAADGYVKRTFATGAPVVGLSLVPGQDAMWVGLPPGTIEKIDLVSGDVLIGPIPVVLPVEERIDTNLGFVPDAVFVLGDQRAAQVVAVPMLPPGVPILLVAILSAVGCRVHVRRRRGVSQVAQT